MLRQIYIYLFLIIIQFSNLIDIFFYLCISVLRKDYQVVYYVDHKNAHRYNNTIRRREILIFCDFSLITQRKETDLSLDTDFMNEWTCELSGHE